MIIRKINSRHVRVGIFFPNIFSSQLAESSDEETFIPGKDTGELSGVLNEFYAMIRTKEIGIDR